MRTRFHQFLVMQYQTYVAQARSTEVTIKGVYLKARAALERALGETLENHDVTIDDVHPLIPNAPGALPK